MLKEDFRMLRLRPVAGVRIHDELSIGQMLSHQESVDRHEHHVLVPVHDQSWVMDLAQHFSTPSTSPDAALALVRGS